MYPIAIRQIIDNRNIDSNNVAKVGILDPLSTFELRSRAGTGSIIAMEFWLWNAD